MLNYLQFIPTLDYINLQDPIRLFLLQIANILRDLNDLVLGNLIQIHHPESIYNTTKIGKSKEIELKKRKRKKVTFFGETSDSFFLTWLWICSAIFSHTWHLMKGMSSLRAAAAGFLAAAREISTNEKRRRIIRTASFAMAVLFSSTGS